MRKITLIIKEKGRYIDIPGLSPFRTPAKIDVTKYKLHFLIQALHSRGITDYEIISTNEKGEVIKYDKEDFDLSMKKKKDETSNLESRLDKLENLLETLILKSDRQQYKNSEQTTNTQLKRIENLLKSGQAIKYTVENISIDKEPVVEEIDNQFIPNIDIDNMELSGKTVEVVEKTSKKDIDDAVSLLSSLTKHGGKK